MFKCDKCGRITKPCEKLVKKPIITRDRVYQEVSKNKCGRDTVKTTFGSEIVKEINLCEKCSSSSN